VELAKLVVDAYPGNVLYLNVLAEAKLKNGDISEANQLFDDAVIKDDENKRAIAWLCRRGIFELTTEPKDVEAISHRAFCGNCRRRIYGIRQKCIYSSCGGYECCDRCLKMQNRSFICDKHPNLVIFIPSYERIAAMRTQREYLGVSI
jgi:hypothetical protein